MKKVLSVGYDFPGNVVETLNFKSKQSLLDADIILFMPTLLDYFGESSTFNGKLLINEDNSQKLSDDKHRWRSELKVAFENGKTIFIFLSEYEDAYIYSGVTGYSGTGLHRQKNVTVDLINNYSFIPLDLGKIISASGSEIKVSKELGVLSTYWNQFKENSSYKAYLENSTFKPILTTKVGDKIVGTIIKKSNGTIILLPPINPEKKHTRYSNDREYWTREGKEFGNRLLHVLLEIDKSLTKGQTQTPAPKWTFEARYKLAKEHEIVSDIEQISNEILSLEEKKKSLEYDLHEEGLLRNLLFETGKPLEKAIIKSLNILGFNAEGYQDSDSEFDVIFSSKEGRFLGEAEGKDNKPINIEKLSQLQRNIVEDFEREGVEDYAKGVLFGNAYRLTDIENRGDFFTEKCIKGANLAKIALVRTPDLFFVAKYLLENDDKPYAELCRKVFFETEGNVTNFPKPNPN